MLCTLGAGAAFGAASVRSLGGAGTYNSVSSAVAAKTDGAMSGGAVNTARAGSLRVNNVGDVASGATRASSARASTTPRLSIGKYLSGSSAISGGSSVSGSGAHKPGVGGGSTDADVKYLEEFVGYTANGDTLPEQLADIKLDVEALAADLSQITGVATTVDYVDGVLMVVQDGQPFVYDLSDDFTTYTEVEQKIEALQAAIDEVQDSYYTKSETDAMLEGYAKKDEIDTTVQEVVQETVNNALVNYELPDNSVTADKLATGAVTADKIDSGTNNHGEMMLLRSNGDGTSSWVAVTVAEAE